MQFSYVVLPSYNMQQHNTRTDLSPTGSRCACGTCSWWQTTVRPSGYRQTSPNTQSKAPLDSRASGFPGRWQKEKNCRKIVKYFISFNTLNRILFSFFNFLYFFGQLFAHSTNHQNIIVLNFKTILWLVLNILLTNAKSLRHYAQQSICRRGLSRTLVSPRFCRVHRCWKG